MDSTVHADSQKFVDYLLNDLRQISNEAKKRYNYVKESAESSIVKVRNISSNSSPEVLFQNLRSSCAEIIHPLILSCSTKNARLVQLSLQAIQHMLQFRIMDRNSIPLLVNELWTLAEAECEELRVLQTITPLVSIDLLVTGSSLAKCIGLAIKLNLSKESSVINAASAAVRQLFNVTFERVVQEDAMRTAELNVIPQSSISNQQNSAPPTLRPSAADGFLLLKDLNLLIRKETPIWLPGVKRITITLALELLETILSGYSPIFYSHAEYAEIIKTHIFPQVLRLFFGDEAITKNSTTDSSQNPHLSYNRPPFPIMIRSLRISLVLLVHYHSILALQNEVIINYLIEMLSSSTLSWESAAVSEVVNKLLNQPILLRWLCENYDCRPTCNRLVNKLFVSINLLLRRCLDEGLAEAETNDEPSDETAELSGFIYRGAYLPLRESNSRRSILLDWLDKHNAERVPDSYSLTISYFNFIDATKSLSKLLSENGQIGKFREPENEENAFTPVLFCSTYVHLLSGLSQLLECSVGDAVIDPILSSLLEISKLAYHFGSLDQKSLSIRALCRAVLMPGYFATFIEKTLHHSSKNLDEQNTASPLALEANEVDLSKAVALGNICPLPNQISTHYNNVVLTNKNLKASRILVTYAHACGYQLGTFWEMILSTIQHLYWVLGIRQISTRSFRIGGEAVQQLVEQISTTTPSIQNSAILTTIASNEIPELTRQLDELFESTSEYDDVALHHVIASLCKLSSDQMEVAQISSREASYFALAKLVQTALVNLNRIEVFWKSVTSHLLEICAHSNACMRNEGCISLVQLINEAMKHSRSARHQSTDSNLDIAKHERMILAPLASLSEISFTDVLTKQLDCVMRILQSDTTPIEAQIWPLVINIVGSLDSSGCELIDQGYKLLSLMVKEFLGTLPFNCVQLLIETDTKYAKQQLHLNVSLSAVGQLWDISDYMRREGSNHSVKETDQLWLTIYHSLAELCVDSRPPIRKSACDSLLQTIAAHGEAMNSNIWAQMVDEVLFPMMDQVYSLTQAASTQRVASTTALGAPNIMIHHSRDTEFKQWAETNAKSTGGVVKVFNAHRATLIQLKEFSVYWLKLMNFIEQMAATDNGEISLAAIKNFKELLVGRQHQFEERKILTSNKASPNSHHTLNEESIPPLPDKLWVVCFNTWLKIAKVIVLCETSNVPILENESSASKHYVPTQFHLTTLFSLFPYLLIRVKLQLETSELQFHLIFSIFKELPKIPIPGEQPPFTLNSRNTELNSVQECLLECIKIMYQESLEPTSKFRSFLPSLLRLLLEFSAYAIIPPPSKCSPLSSEVPKESLISFAEVCLKTFVDYYIKVALFEEVVNERIFVDAVNSLNEPLMMKYSCPRQSIWQLAATSFRKVCKIGLPIARENRIILSNHYNNLWSNLASTIGGFLFSTSKSSSPLNPTERKQHEFLDCLMVEMVRIEILPFANRLPTDFINQIIEILNRGSLNTMDANDITASDAYAQRVDLSKVCFDALLELGQLESRQKNSTGAGKQTKNNVSGSFSLQKANSQIDSLGATAIASLLNRCKQVLNNYARDDQGSRQFRLPQERIFEVISVLRAISTLIDGMLKESGNLATFSTLYSHLVNIYPNLVQLIPSCRSDQQIELALMTAFNSYQSLLLINLHKNPN